MCGIFAVTQNTNAARLVNLGLFALQHRGQESAGISVWQGEKLLTHVGESLVTDVFDENILEKLNGSHAIGHVRYSTAGGNTRENFQPLEARVAGTPMSVVHNGNIVNAKTIRTRLENEGSIFRGTADTEVVLHLMAKSQKEKFSDKLLESVPHLLGAYTLIILTPTHLYGVVDPWGYRPLVLGKLGESYILSSETCALDLVGAQFVRNVGPGELLSIDLASGKLESNQIGFPDKVDKREARCSFEHIYFARPDSQLWDETSQDVRFELGKTLATEKPVEADLVMAVPDSGVPMAMGYAAQANLPYKVGLIRNHYVGRTFIEPTQNLRNLRVRMKLNPVRAAVNGKRVIVVDDSIVRGTTSAKIIELLREAGAKEVHMRIASPEVKFSCYYGIDTPQRKDLLAQKLTSSEMVDFLKADSVEFLSQKGLLATLDNKKGWCISCFSGKYLDPVAQEASS